MPWSSSIPGLPTRAVRRLADADFGSTPDRAARLRQAVVEPLAHGHGVSDKVLSMALANLLLGADRRRVLWTEAGAVMIAVDTLVHNFLHRTGILGRLDAAHLYGPAMRLAAAPRSSNGSPAASMPGAFNPANDPYAEHDCAILTVDGVRVLFKLDYYDRNLAYHSPDPTDPKATERVPTVMLADEY
jgi:uncharacterized protein DUF3768